MNKDLESFIFRKFEASEIIRIDILQKLWDNYGDIKRVILDTGSIIIKQVSLLRDMTARSHPKGWNTSNSHKRKIQSYEVERQWYQRYNDEITYAHSPKLRATFNNENTIFLILEDLQENNFQDKKKIENHEVKLCIKWLAYFHAYYLSKTPTELWPKGSYWHLETRQDEHQAMASSKLKELADYIDQKLNGARYKTIIHGDAKLANFLFNSERVSAVDFQYVGGGVGVKDLVYFLTSIYSSDELFEHEKESMDYYFSELTMALQKYHPSINSEEVVKEWMNLYDIAACDFYRFLKGWSPQHTKLNAYSEYMIKKVEKCF